VVIRELIGNKNFREDPKWIAKKLAPKITEQQAKMALEELIQLGLIRRENSDLVQVDSHITAPDDVVSTAVRKFHGDMSQRAAEALHRFKVELREITGVTFELSEENLGLVKEKIRKFRTELVEMTKKGSRASRIYQLNIQLFPLTERLENE